jgi:hypothetical protein
MFTKQESIMKFTTPSVQVDLSTIKDNVVSVQPDGPCSQNDHFHETIKAKPTPLLFYHAHGQEGEVPNNTQRGPTRLCKFTAKEKVVQSFFLIMIAEHTIRAGDVETLSTQEIPCVKTVIE